MISGEGKLFTLVRCDSDEEWREERRKGIGGSDVAAIMGLSQWRGPYTVWAEKCGIAEPEDISDKPSVVWGNLLEHVIGEHFRSEHPEMVVRRVNAICRSIERPWAQASLDYEIVSPDMGPGVLEIKTAGFRSSDEWDYGVPVFYQTQVAHYLSVTGRSYAYVAVLIGGQDYREYLIERDEDDISAVNSAVDDFWQLVIERREPTAEPVDASILFKSHEEPSSDLVINPEAGRVLAEWLTACDDLKRASEAKREAETKLKQMIGDSRGLSMSDGSVLTWVRSHRSRLDVKALSKDHPEIREQYTTTVAADMGLRFKSGGDSR